MTKIIGICGGSGSGKTTLANQLHQYLKETSSLLAMDDYYKPIKEQQKDANGIVNFDLPTALNIPQFINDLETLKSGAEITIENYDFNTKKGPKTFRTIESNKYVITEGIFLLCNDKVLNLIDYIIFVDAPEHVMFERRMARDTKDRDIEKEIVRYQWKEHFIPAYHYYILPHMAKADIVLDGTQSFLAEEVLRELL